ncbi:MAG TPA: ferritin-like domain-containing protein [Minicystis sp.]|nr:ferritin-like domain-containing protein [Minicystis sp.]
MCGTGTECFEWASDTPCPDQASALQHFPSPCTNQGCYIESVDSGATQSPSQCCYAVTESYCELGRPFVVAGRRRVAAIAARAAARDWSDARLTPDTAGLSAEAREALAAAWSADGLLEHASVAAFSRFSLELMALGAPRDLVRGAHEAALDEVRHAELCFALASAYAGAAVEPERLDVGVDLDLARDLASLAVRAFDEGCVGETIAAIVAAEQLAHATDPAVRAALERISADEARHAELAWRTAAWAVEVGGHEVVGALERALARALAAAPPRAADAPADAGAMQAHGRLDAARARDAFARGLADVVAPCARALLARSPSCVAEGRREASAAIVDAR